MKYEYQERIDKYVQGKMTDNERVAFESEVALNDELRDQLLYTQQVKKLVTSREEKLKKLMQWNDMEIQIVSGKKSRKRTLYWVSGIAAVLVVGFYAIKPVFNHDDVLPNGQLREGGELFERNDSRTCTPKVLRNSKGVFEINDSILNDTNVMENNEE